MDDHDRDAILARRSMLISAALAGLACTSPPAPSRDLEPEPPDERGPELVVEAHPTPVASPQKPPTHESLRTEGPRPPWSEVLANTPPLDVPEHLDLSEDARRRLEYLASSGRERYERFAPYWDALPTPDAKDCDQWLEGRKLVGGLTREEATCGPAPTTTHTFVERARLHDQYIAELAEFALPEFDAAIQSLCPLRRAKRMPRACLSCFQPTLVAIIAALPFTTGEAQLERNDAIDATFETVISNHRHNRREGARLLVRGHADPGEDQPVALARARAEAVVAMLVRLGLAADELEVRAYAADLPISRDPRRAALNRRVDFEVLPAPD